MGELGEIVFTDAVSFIIINPDGTAGSRGPSTNDESGVAEREQLAQSHERRVQAVENAIVEGASQATCGDENLYRIGGSPSSVCSVRCDGKQK